MSKSDAGARTGRVTHCCFEHAGQILHVITTEVGVHVGMSGPFTLARSADGGRVGNLENQLAGVVVDQDGDVATLLSRWETVRNEALSHRHSIDSMKEAVDSCT
ncbi:Scr1 family TA system antitoxin-like transcriptional regulator [Micromonospora sp. DT4]|uniref:Scr1 family TA system antitoxin-like transcriptional regulator n=1 Tax=Micromonospora sp. DT4 TaxID=3393438 RepID=UPI003CF1B41D